VRPRGYPVSVKPSTVRGGRAGAEPRQKGDGAKGRRQARKIGARTK